MKERKVIVSIELLTAASIKELKDFYRDHNCASLVKQIQVNVIKNEKGK